MTERVEEATRKTTGDGLMKELHADRLVGELQNLLTAMAQRAALSLVDRIEDTAGRLTGVTEGDGTGLLSALTGGAGNGGGSSLKERLAPGLNAAKAFVGTKLRQKLGGGKGAKGGKGKKLKVTNVVETLDVGVPVRLAYDQWTQFTDFPSFTKKVENVEQESDEKLHWKAQVFWSHREWDSTIIEQVPDRRIVWRSKGAKGHVDGAVTFHEVAPELTRIVLVLEYHPQGLFERTGNLWRAQGRRARLEFKHIRRHMMTQAVLHPDEIEGWRGEIHDGHVVKDHETALREEREGEQAGPEERGERSEERPGEERPGEERPGEEYEDEYSEDEYGPEDYDEDYDQDDEEDEREGREGGGARDEDEEDEDEEYEEYEEPGERDEAGDRGGEHRAGDRGGEEPPARRREPSARPRRREGAEERPHRTTAHRTGARHG